MSHVDVILVNKWRMCLQMYVNVAQHQIKQLFDIKWKLLKYYKFLTPTRFKSNVCPTGYDHSKGTYFMTPAYTKCLCKAIA